MKSYSQLRPYQHRMIEYIRDNPKCALWVDMGLGKTVSTLTAIQQMQASREIGKVLVIAPLRVCRMVWPEEVKEWDHLNLTVKCAAGLTPDRRWRALKSKADVHVINRDLVHWLVGNHKAHFDEWPWDTVVIDESSSFKSAAARRFRYMKRVLPQIHTLVQLSGTPMPNSIEDLWSQIYLLDEGQRLGRTITAFRNRWTRTTPFSMYKREPTPNALKEVKDLTKDLVLSLKAEDYLELPNILENNIEVEMGPSQRKKYEDMRRESLLELDGKTVVAVQLAGVWNKLCQLANGAVYTGEESEWVQLHNHKLDALIELDELVEGPMIVVYSYRHDRERIIARYEKEAIPYRTMDTREDEEAWNDGQVHRLILHPASAGHGLNLHKSGCRDLVWFGLTPNLEYWLQANARITGGHRAAGAKPITVHRITTRGTQDELLHRMLARKKGFQAALRSAARRFVESAAKT